MPWEQNPRHGINLRMTIGVITAISFVARERFCEVARTLAYLLTIKLIASSQSGRSFAFRE